MRFVIVTGLSGAGKSMVIRYLEDMEYFCMDNLPPMMIPKFLELCRQSGRIQRVAIVVDVRGGTFFDDMDDCLRNLDKSGVPYEILFMEASDEVLIARYKESRRAHPLIEQGSVAKGIAEERTRLAHIKGMADHVVDTSGLLPKDLRTIIVNLFAADTDTHGMTITILSFGYKYGLPLEADLVFDVRFLPNPFYVDGLKEKSGLDEPVRKYIFKFDQTGEFISRLDGLLAYLIPYYMDEGKAHLVIGIGCTGGRHRSVTIAERLSELLAKHGYRVTVEHRDIERRRD